MLVSLAGFMSSKIFPVAMLVSREKLVVYREPNKFSPATGRYKFAENAYLFQGERAHAISPYMVYEKRVLFCRPVVARHYMPPLPELKGRVETRPFRLRIIASFATATRTSYSNARADNFSSAGIRRVWCCFRGRHWYRQGHREGN